jgi:uncharacterized protein (DUF885 family)
MARGSRRIQSLALTVGLAFLLVACAPGERPTPDHGARVAELAEECWQDLLERSPYLQVRQGRLIRRLPDATEAQAQANVEFSRSVLERIDEIPRDALAHEDVLTLDLLRWEAEQAIAGLEFYWLNFPFTPYQAGFSFNFVHQQLQAHPFDEPEAHPENYLTVLGEYSELLGQLRAHIDGQVERGIYLSRHAIPGTAAMFEGLLALVPSVMGVSEDRLGALSEEEREAFLAAVDEQLTGHVLPAFEALLDALRAEEYARNAPDEVGLAVYPGGDRYYRLLVRGHTTMDASPEALHDLGKLRVAELEARMAAIREEVGFTGGKAEFHRRLRTDPRFIAKSPEEVEARFEEYIARIEPLIPDYFHETPRAPYGVTRLNAAAETSMTFGYYAPPTPDQPTGLYHYNGSQLDDRPQIWSGPLIYHELVPGHHFHIASQSENEALPDYRREYLGAGAFNEGWGNYGALLAGEMGLLDDPYDRYGAALFDIFISARLVLDTGMNLMGWSLEEGRAYMAEHTFASPTEIATETLRYSTDLNGQALAYKAGLEKLLELREAARARAGDTFDVRDFHHAVLGSGALPMQVLEHHLDWYFGPDGPAAADRPRG